MSDVRAFGAVGDGLADDTDAIEHALANHDGVVSFSRGEYRITRTLKISLDKQGPLALEGVGSSAKIRMAGQGPAIQLLGTHQGTADPSSISESTWTRERCPVIQNLEILGGHAEADGIELIGCWQPNLIGVSIHDVRHGIRLAVRNRNVIIDRCHIYHNSGIGIFLDQVNLHQINITGSHISYNQFGGIRIESSEVRNLQITGNDIEYNNSAQHTVEAGVVPGPTAEIYLDCGDTGSMREITIASNTIQSTASFSGCNIRLKGSEEANHRIGMLTLSGNLIGSQETNLHATRCRGLVINGNYIYGAEFRNLVLEDCENVTFSGNCIGANPDYQVPIRQVGVRLVGCQGVNISGDIIEGMPPVDPQLVSEQFQPASALLEIEQSQGVLVSGCQWIDSSPAAVHVVEGSAITLHACQALDRRPTTQREWTIRWTGDGSHNAIRQCLLTNGQRGSVSVNEASGVLLDGNLDIANPLRP